MSKVGLKGEEVEINLGHGIKIFTTSEGVNRANRVEIDEKRYIHGEVYNELEIKRSKLAQKLENVNANYHKLEKQWIWEKDERKRWEDKFFEVRDIAIENMTLKDRWKTRFIIMAAAWFFTALILLIVI